MTAVMAQPSQNTDGRMPMISMPSLMRASFSLAPAVNTQKKPRTQTMNLKPNHNPNLQHLLRESEGIGDVRQSKVRGNGRVVRSLGAATVRVAASEK